MAAKSWIVVAVTAFAIVGWMGLGTASVAGSPAAAPVAHTTAPAAAATPGAASPVSGVGGTPNVAAGMAASALAATRAAGLKPNIVFVPRPSATAGQLSAAAESGVVSPLYSGQPAPMGLAYYGLSGTGSGTPTGTILNTTAVQGQVDANATGIQGLDLYQSSPDSYGVQLNAVTTDITLFGTHGYSFWTQNVVEYYPAADFMVLVTNIWNFSGQPISANALYSHGPYGTNEYGLLGYYYAEAVIPFPVTYPFNLTLTMTSGLTDGRNNVSFDVNLTSTATPSEDFNAPYDWAVFNSIAGAGPSLSAPSNYTANGFHYNPIGLTDDFELDICGPGGGSQVDLSTADATLGLAYLSGGYFVSTPAAYSYGGETGETATGANIAWSNAPGGPAGLTDYGTMTTGPSILTGLWGTGAPEGSYPVTVDVTPANAFNFFNFTGAVGFSTPFVNEQAYAPSMDTNTFYLMPGSYDLQTQLADFQGAYNPLTVSGPTTVVITLSSGDALGDYTPLWAFSNAEVAVLSSGGVGTALSPYEWDLTGSSVISSNYGLYNDYGFPVFPGVFLMGTTATVVITQGTPALTVATNDVQYPATLLPATNHPQMWFWSVSNVAIDGSAIPGTWFAASAYYPIDFDSFSVVFYNSSNNLVAGNDFSATTQGLLMFAGGTLFGALNTGGGNNTIWGNRFTMPSTLPVCAKGSGCLELLGPGSSLAFQVAEGGDLFYNNYVDTATTAFQLPLNMYSGYDAYYNDSWNIAPQPAANVHHAAGFPTIPLSGSIIGSADQGGNFWWDYGLLNNPYNGADNPYGVLPYDENAITLTAYIYGCDPYYCLSYIYSGGDYAPLTAPLYAVAFHETGLLPGTPWGVSAINSTSVLEVNFTTTLSSYALYLPAGGYDWSPHAVTGYTTASGGHFVLTSHGKTLAVAFRLAHGYAILTVRESGLPSGTRWAAEIIGTSPATDAFNATQNTTGTSMKFLVIDGTYYFAVPGVPGYTPSPSAGSLTITGATSLHVRFHPTVYGLLFDETGLTTGTRWGITIKGHILDRPTTQSETLYTTGTSVAFVVPNGTYSYTVWTPFDYVCSVCSGGPVAPSILHNGGGNNTEVAGTNQTVVIPFILHNGGGNGSGPIAIPGLHTMLTFAGPGSPTPLARTVLAARGLSL